MDETAKIVQFQKVPASKEDLTKWIYIIGYELGSGDKGVATLPDSKEITEEMIQIAIRSAESEKRKWQGKEITI
jgi:hypothetical protein